MFLSVTVMDVGVKNLMEELLSLDAKVLQPTKLVLSETERILMVLLIPTNQLILTSLGIHTNLIHTSLGIHTNLILISLGTHIILQIRMVTMSQLGTHQNGTHTCNGTQTIQDTTNIWTSKTIHMASSTPTMITCLPSPLQPKLPPESPLVSPSSPPKSESKERQK